MNRRVAIIGCQHETNTFLADTTDLAAFDQGTIYGSRAQGQEILSRIAGGWPVPAAGFVRAAPGLGLEPVPLDWVFAEPSGSLTGETFEALATRIVDAVDTAAPLAGVYLDLHGAMVAETQEDGEGEILRRLRERLGSHVPLVASLDLHGNVTELMVEAATALVAYRTYPHVDMDKTGERAAHLMAAALSGSALFTAFAKPPFLIPIHRQTTYSEPMRSLYASMEAIEARPEIMSLSLLCGFPLSDIAECGPAILAYATSAAAAQRSVNELAAMLDDEAGSLSPTLPGAPEAVRLAMAHRSVGPAIIADVQDNPGGGGSGDTVWLLEALIAAGAEDAVVAMIADRQSAVQAHAAGVGATQTFALGGRGSDGHAPLVLPFTVKALAEGPFRLTGPMSGGAIADIGPMALLQHRGVDVIVAGRRTQAHDRAFFARLGVDPTAHRIIVLKSANHYRADFEPIAGTIIEAGCPGACVMDPRTLPYRKLRPGVRLGPGENTGATE